MPLGMLSSNQPTPPSPSFLGAGGVAGHGAGATSTVLDVPSVAGGFEPGDLLIATFADYYQFGFPTGDGFPDGASTGWANPFNIVCPQGMVWVMTHVYADGDPSSYTVTYPSNYGQTIGVIVAYRNVYASFDDSGITSITGTSITTPSLDTNYVNDMIVLIYQNNIQNAYISEMPSGTNTRVNFSGGSNYPIGICDTVRSSKGATGGYTADVSSAGWGAAAIALRAG
jgi:hypothetical protein